MERVNTIVFPQPAVNLILLLKIWHKVYQDGDGFSWHHPAPHPHLKAVLLSLPLPIGKERLVLSEIGTFLLCVITVLSFPQVWTDKYHLILMCLLQGLGTRRKDCIDSTYFVTNFSTRFKNVVGLQKTFYHRYNYKRCKGT